MQKKKKKGYNRKLLLTTYITGICQTKSKDIYTYISSIYKCHPFFHMAPPSREAHC